MKAFENLPEVTQTDAQMITDNYNQIRLDIQDLIDQEMYKLETRQKGMDEEDI